MPGDWQFEKLRLGVPRVMPLGALGKKTLAASLTAPRERCASALCAHAGTESMLAFPGAL
jgi:hypothetical protein